MRPLQSDRDGLYPPGHVSLIDMMMLPFRRERARSGMGWTQGGGGSGAGVG